MIFSFGFRLSRQAFRTHAVSPQANPESLD